MPIPDFRGFFSARNAAANFLRAASLVICLILFAVTYETWQEYLHDRENFPEGASRAHVVAKDKGGEAQPDVLQEAITPFWLLSMQAAATAIAVLALAGSLVLGRVVTGQIIVLSLICASVVLVWLPADIAANYVRMNFSQAGEVPAPLAYLGQLILTSLLLLSPVALMVAYHSSSIMDRYVIRNVATPLALCFFGFIAIWLIIDLTDNGRDFITADAGLDQLGFYYLVQLPQMVVLVLPITLLLSILYALGKMSRSNEIISMLGSGRSLVRVLQPILIIGLYCSLVGSVLNYNWAPRAEAHKEAILNSLSDRAQDKHKDEEEWAAMSWMYHNTTIGHERTWYVGRVPLDVMKSPLRYVAIWWENDEGRLFRSYRADYATWRDAPDNAPAVQETGWTPVGYWTLRKCYIWEYDEFGTATQLFFPVLEIPDWTETPWHVVSSSLNPEYLGIPELTTYLRTNFDKPANRLAPYRTYWHYCFAEPFRCFFLALMAAPLGIVHSRRGVLGGVAACILIFFGLIFMDGVFLTMGRIGQFPGWLGAWGPDLILAAVGAFLLWIRSGNREITKPHTWLQYLFPARKKASP